MDGLRSQLSVAVALPPVFEGDCGSWQLMVILAGHAVITGAILSATVTVAKQTSEWLLWSFTTAVTELGPILEQVKLLGFTIHDTMLQLSVLPPATSVPVMVTFPVEFRYTVMFWHTATGLISSTIVTVAVHMEELAGVLLSVTVRVTELAPRSTQAKAVLLSVSEASAQLSVDPLFTSCANTVTCPVLSRNAVTFLQFATGGILSTTV